MGFFGMSPAGNAAAGQVGELGRWNFDQYKKWLDLQNQYAEKGGPAIDWAGQYWKQRAETGFPTVAQTRATGAEIMPGIAPAVANRAQRGELLWGTYAQLPGANEPMSEIYRNLDTRGEMIPQHTEAQQGLIDELARTLYGREEGADAEIMKDLERRYGSIENAINENYNLLRKQTAGTYEGLQGSLEGTFDTAFKDVEGLKPGGELQRAQVATSYAPAMASAAARLRRAGIDPNSPEASAYLGKTEAGRARGMDEAAARTVEQYIREKTGLGLQRQAGRERLGLGKVGAEGELVREQTGLITGAKREQGQLYRNELVRSLAAKSGIDVSRAEASSANLLQNFQQRLSLLDDKNKAALLHRALQDQDFARLNNVLQTLNQNELESLGLEAQEFQAGLQYQQLQIGDRDNAAMQVLGIGAADYQRAIQAAATASGYSQQALQQALQTYSLEQQSAGWGVKMLAGIAMGAINYLTGKPDTSGGVQPIPSASGAAGSAPFDWGSYFGGSSSTGWTP